MKIRVRHRLLWVYDWDSTDGRALKVKPRTAQRWRRVIDQFMRLQDHIGNRIQPKQVKKVVAA